MKHRVRSKLSVHKGLVSLPLTQAVLAEVCEVNHNKSAVKSQMHCSLLVCA